ncbi:hypothetical protein VTK26DRAFT_5402 [Humicola hyalothermophila]
MLTPGSPFHFRTTREPEPNNNSCYMCCECGKDFINTKTQTHCASCNHKKCDNCEPYNRETMYVWAGD